MFIHRSNRVERLVASLSQQLRADRSDPLRPRTLVVPSPGMAQFLTMELARVHGVSAHVEVLRPREMIERILGEPAATWRREVLAWALFEELGALEDLGDGVADGPGRWLQGADDARRHQLAWRLADLFDQYAVYRPDEVLRWEEGRESGWQARLWRAVVGRLGDAHPARLARRAVDRLAASTIPGLPERFHVFGVSTLPPLYLRLLAACGAWSEVHLYVLSPGPEFWAELDEQTVPDLLVSLGRVGADLQQLIEEVGEYQEEDLYEPPSRDSMLGHLQADLFELDRAGEVRVHDPADRSVQILVCHSPGREVEALRDELRGRLEADPTLSPRDVVIMTPDISVHGPIIDAVFGRQIDDPLYVPYHVADRPMLAHHACARALLAVLELAGRRFTPGEVLGLLDHGPLRERFGFTEADVALLDPMVDAAAIRWGRDGAHRGALGVPADGQNTWRAGLDRLVLGMALDGSDVFAGVVPVDGVSGETAERVGRLALLVDAVEGAVDGLGQRRDVAGHVAVLRGLVDGWFGELDERSGEVQALRQALAGLEEEAALAGFAGVVDFGPVGARFEACFRDERHPGGFLRGGMTVCEMLPMRAVPFRVVCLLGQTQGLFPRSDNPLSFDIRHKRQRGDRSRRHEDRWMFLEALLSAREALVLTTVGRGVRDDRPKAPGPTVFELEEAIRGGWGEDVLAQVRHELPLQAFSARYAEPGGPLTWDVHAGRAATSLRRGERQEGGLGEVGAAEPGPVLQVDDLLRFVRDPVAAWLEQRLGLSRWFEDDGLAEADPVLVDDTLEGWQLGDRWLKVRLSGVPADEVVGRLQASGWLGAGPLAAEFGEIGAQVEALVRRAEPLLGAGPPQPLPVDLVVAGQRVVGRLDDLRPGLQLEITWKRVVDEHALAVAFVRHLLMVVAGRALPTVVVGRGKEGPTERRFQLSAADARVRLEAVIALYRAGMARPLAVLPAVASTWWRARADAEGAWEKATRAQATLLRERVMERRRWRTVFGEGPLPEGEVPDYQLYAEVLFGGMGEGP